MNRLVMSNFTFLKSEWPDLHESALKVEAFADPDPRTSCFYARLTLELAVHWLYKHDAALKLPQQENLSVLIHEPTFKQLVGNAVFAKATRPCNNRDRMTKVLRPSLPAVSAEASAIFHFQNKAFLGRPGELSCNLANDCGCPAMP